MTGASNRRNAAGLAVAVAALAALPFLNPADFWLAFLYLGFHWVVLATSWNILSGYSGYFSFGHGAFFGVGMYATAALAAQWGVPFLLTLPAAALLPALLGLGLGAVAFRVRRVRGELFALLTLAVTFVVATIILNTPVDGGPGVAMMGVEVPAIAPSPSGVFYLLGLAVMVLTLWTAWAVARSRLGVGLFAIHDDEDAAEVMGVPTYRYKLVAFALSSGLAGLAGGIHALFVSYVTVGETFSIAVPLTVVLMSVLGGTRQWYGPAIGALLINALTYGFSAGPYAVVARGGVGLVLLAAILLMPSGIAGRLGRNRPASATEPAAPPAAVPPSASPVMTGEVLLAARGAAKSFRGIRALAGVDLEIRRGEIVALIGPNGSGKSTLINVVSGHHRADAGSVRFAACELVGRPAHRVARLGLARTYQIPRPFDHLSVLDNVALPAMFGAAALDRAAAEAEARRWLAFAGLADKAAALPGELNLHQRKFLEVARALAARPSLLFLDEALSGLTPTEIDEAIRLIRAIRDQGTTIVFVEHVMRAVTALADRVVVLCEGRLIAQGEPRQVMRLPEVVAAYLGQPDV